MNRILAAILAMGLASSGVAQGEIVVGSINNTGFVFGDFVVAFETDTIGVSVGMFGTVGRLHETYASLDFPLGQLGKLELGFPAPAFDRFAQSQFLQFFPVAGLPNAGISRSRVTQGAMTQTKYLPYGAAFAAQDWAVSLHTVPDYDTTIVSAAGQRDFGAIEVSGAIEAVRRQDDWRANAKLSLRKGTLSLAYFAPQANGEDDYWEVAAQGRLTETVLIRAAALSSTTQDRSQVGFSAHMAVAAQMDIGVDLVWQPDASNSVGVTLSRQF
tara:strand:- start:34637 stop:35449 length:813 start_codon:yes stop_codon:yes gene_type:complete